MTTGHANERCGLAINQTFTRLQPLEVTHQVILLTHKRTQRYFQYVVGSVCGALVRFPPQ